MGDFSRDPKQRLADSIAKHYVGVRMQQGVPILDADWNELEDLRKHELHELVRSFVGDGVPDGSDGFRLQALAGGGVDTLVLQTISTITEHTSLEVVLGLSTAADRLGFLPGDTISERFGSSPAILNGDAAAPFFLAAGMTLTVRVNGGVDQTVTFTDTDFVDISHATISEVYDVLNANLIGVTASAGEGSNFRIIGGEGTLLSAGRILAEGAEALIENDIMFTSQPLYQNTELASLWGVDEIPQISEVTEGRQDIVYLDVWEREVGFDEDVDIVQPVIGIETARRLRREWAVRFEENATDLTGITRQDGHKYTPLAILTRTITEGNAITDESISDARRTQINVSKYLKTPVYVLRGSSTLTAENVAKTFETLQHILLRRYRERIFGFVYADNYNRAIVLHAIEAIMNYASYAASQIRSGNFNNQDAVAVFLQIYDLQSDFVSVVQDYGNDDGDSHAPSPPPTQAQEFIDDYLAELVALDSATTAGDLIQSDIAQQNINTWLSLDINELPEGSILVVIDDVQPTTNLDYNTPFNITYRIESRLSSSREQEEILISVDSASPTPWEFSLNTESLIVDALGGVGTVVLTVTPRAGGITAAFNLTVAAALNEPGTNHTHTSPSFQIGMPPAAEPIVEWTSPAFNDAGFIPFTESAFNDNFGDAQYEVSVINTSDEGLEQIYEVTVFVIPPTGEEAEWAPLEADATPILITVAAGAIETGGIRTLHGPTPAVVGTHGTIVVEANLIEEGGSLPSEPRSERLELGFEVVVDT